MRIRCPHCDQRFLVADDQAGQRVLCPNMECQQALRVPQRKTSAQPTPPGAAVVAKPGRPVGVSPSAGVPSASGRKKRLALRQLSWIGIVSLGLMSGVIFGLVSQDSARSPSGLAAVARAAESPAAAVPAASYEHDLQPFVQKYCADCHGKDSPSGDFALDRYTDLASILKDRAIWTKLLKLVELGSMPPHDAEQPTPGERKQAVAWLDRQLFYVDCNAEQDPGRVTIRRLNRTEYNNTVNALLGIDFRPADDFPSDDVGHGFDNIGDVLTVPPLLIEKYLAAAEAIAQASARTTSPLYFKKRIFAKDKGDAADDDVFKVFASHGHVSRVVNFPRDGEYKLKIFARQDRGGNEPAKMAVSLDKQLLSTVEVKNTAHLEVFEVPFRAAAGKQELTVAFINDFYDEKAEKDRDRNLHLGQGTLEGPIGLTEEERQRMPLLKVQPVGGITVAQAASENLKEFLPRAFRRPVTEQELGRYSALAQSVTQNGGSFEDAMQVALEAILVSPDFLFRVEGGRRQTGGVETLDDFALASRLSYFLWSSCPDDELFALAQENRLHELDVLKSQTRRMLQDPRADQLIANFSSQWLGLRKLFTSEIDPDRDLFPEFTAEIRADLAKETELFCGSVVRADRSIFDLLTGKYTYLNERLAKFYGIEGVSGAEFRQVDLAGQHRAGVTTQGSVLTLTSYPNRTSPVKRGDWVLSVLLGDAPPPPPPMVPGLDQTTAANPNLSFRESLELHRADPGCAACHQTMDAIGFGLENFDAVGRWRTTEKGRPVDASGRLPDGQTFAGPEELVGVLTGRRDDFSRCLTEKLMTYALGRGVEWYDRCAVDRIVQDLEQDERFSNLVLGIVTSAPFQARRLSQAASVDSAVPVNE